MAGAPGTGGAGVSGGAGRLGSGGGSGSGVEEGGDGGEDAAVGGAGGGPGSGASGGRATGGSGSGSGSGGSGGVAGDEPAAGASGSAAQGGQPPLSLPAGCEAREQSADATSCFLDFVCTSQELDAVACGDLGAGRWKCTCGQAFEGRTFELEGVAEEDACVVAAGLCNDPLEVGDETCVEVYDDGTANGCSLTLSCGKPIAGALRSDLRAWLTSYPNGHCQRDREGLPFACTCAVDGVSTDYGILAESGASACRPLVDFCRSGTDPVFDGDISCVDEYARETPDGCSLDQACATPLRLTDDVSLARLQRRSAFCTPLELGGSMCSCSRPSLGGDASETFQFEIEGEADAAACDAAALDCEWGAAIEPLGPVSCRPDGEVAAADSCDSYLVCRQPASVDGREVVAFGALLVQCERLASGSPWACSCASGPDSARFDLGAAGLEPAAACAAAPALCMEQVSVHLGPYGEAPLPPDPLPDRAR